MRILLLCHSFNSLSQRLYAELAALGHTLSVELDIADSVTEEAVALFRPDLLIAPFLKRRIPDSVWRALPCFIVHPGPPGDRGPAALDWAILEGRAEWGVTVLQADGDFDAGPVWAHAGFPMRAASKGALISYAKTLAVETGKRGVTVNVIAPGFVDTDMMAPYAAYRDKMQGQIPAGRFARPEEVGGLAAFLMSEPAAYITGTVIPIDGGVTAQLGVHR